MARGALHARVFGLVQGVGFRYHARQVARAHGLSGWVQNHADGSVEVWAEGAEADLEALLAWLRRGPPAAEVSDVHVEREVPRGLEGFDVRRA